MPCVRTPQGGSRSAAIAAFQDKTASAVDQDLEDHENGVVPLASLREAQSRNCKERREAWLSAALREDEQCRVQSDASQGEADCGLCNAVSGVGKTAVCHVYGTLNSKLHRGGVGRAIPDCTVTAPVSGVKASAFALSVGATVQIHSLVNAQELNGLEGVLVEYDASKQRWRVWVAGGRTVGIKGANLIMVCEPLRFASSDLESINLAAPSPPVSNEAPATGYAHTPHSASSISFMSGGRLYVRARAGEVKELAGSGCAEEDLLDEEEVKQQQENVKQEEQEQEEEQEGPGEEEELSRSEREIMKMGRRVEKVLASFSLPDSEDKVIPL
jgi:hypothetical protein